MIEENVLSQWKMLQDFVCRILNECGYHAESPKKIDVVRGQVEVDVYAIDEKSQPQFIYICECKNWDKRIPQEVVHSFRTVVNDSGAHIGMIISSKGFQSGAYEAAKSTNIKLLSWEEFQNEFCDRWYEEFFMPTLHHANDPLVEYTEPINTRIQRKADLLEKEAFERFLMLRKKYELLSYFAMGLYIPLMSKKYSRPSLPVDSAAIKGKVNDCDLPENIFSTKSYRGLLNVLLPNIEQAISEFDKLFGERA